MKRPMQRLTLAIGALVVAVPMAVAQGNGNGNGKGNARNAAPVAGHCPPGLAKKNPPCVPPGQARNVQPERDVYRDHDRIIYSRGEEMVRRNQPAKKCRFPSKMPLLTTEHCSEIQALVAAQLATTCKGE